MPSSLPTDPALTKSVDTFGNGAYDGQRDDEPHGEDDEGREPTSESLPSETAEGFDFEFWLSYPQEQALGPKHASLDWFIAALPGDADRPPPGPRPADSTVGDPSAAPSDVRTSDSELPDDEMNPAARADYYDRQTMGSDRKEPGTARLLTESDLMSALAMGAGDYWPSEDSGSYVTQEQKSPELVESDEPGTAYEDEDGHYVDESGDIESFPEPERNDNFMDDNLGALGNSDSGYVVEDMSNPRGFPNTDFTEQSDFIDENPILPEVWHLQPFGYASNTGVIMNRTANSIDKVQDLTKEFLKEHGKKGIVRRSVTAFLESRGLPQYLASDVVRCMAHDHKIVVPDVLDIFPLAEDAPADVRRLAAVHAKVVEMQMGAKTGPAAVALHRAASSLVSAMARMSRDSDLRSSRAPGTPPSSSR